MNFYYVREAIDRGEGKNLFAQCRHPNDDSDGV